MADEARGLGEGARENAEVTSKFDRDQGKPRTPGRVGSPGHQAEPTFNPERHAPSASRHEMHGKVHSYHPDHPAMAGLEHGARAIHPMNDAKQDRYESKHGIHGDHNEHK